ncbi:MAG: hypothetical protein ACLTQP_01085 [Faecalibacterium prausnitzii]
MRAIRYKADFTYWERDAAEGKQRQRLAAGWPCDSWRYVVEDVEEQGHQNSQVCHEKEKC